MREIQKYAEAGPASGEEVAEGDGQARLHPCHEDTWLRGHPTAGY